MTKLKRVNKFVVAAGGAVVAWGLFFGIDLSAPVAATVSAVSAGLVWLVPNGQ